MHFSLNLDEVTAYFKNTLSCENENAGNGGKLDDRLQPIPSEIHGAVVRTDAQKLQAYENEGMYMHLIFHFHIFDLIEI